MGLARLRRRAQVGDDVVTGVDVYLGRLYAWQMTGGASQHAIVVVRTAGRCCLSLEQVVDFVTVQVGDADAADPSASLLRQFRGRDRLQPLTSVDRPNGLTTPRPGATVAHVLAALLHHKVLERPYRFLDPNAASLIDVDVAEQHRSETSSDTSDSSDSDSSDSDSSEKSESGRKVRPAPAVVVESNGQAQVALKPTVPAPVKVPQEPQKKPTVLEHSREDNSVILDHIQVSNNAGLVLQETSEEVQKVLEQSESSNSSDSSDSSEETEILQPNPLQPLIAAENLEQIHVAFKPPVPLGPEVQDSISVIHEQSQPGESDQLQHSKVPEKNQQRPIGEAELTVPEVPKVLEKPVSAETSDSSDSDSPEDDENVPKIALGTKDQLQDFKVPEQSQQHPIGEAELTVPEVPKVLEKPVSGGTSDSSDSDSSEDDENVPKITLGTSIAKPEATSVDLKPSAPTGPEVLDEVSAVLEHPEAENPVALELPSDSKVPQQEDVKVTGDVPLVLERKVSFGTSDSSDSDSSDDNESPKVTPEPSREVQHLEQVPVALNPPVQTDLEVLLDVQDSKKEHVVLEQVLQGPSEVPPAQEKPISSDSDSSDSDSSDSSDSSADANNHRRVPPKLSDQIQVHELDPMRIEVTATSFILRQETEVVSSGTAAVAVATRASSSQEKVPAKIPVPSDRFQGRPQVGPPKPPKLESPPVEQAAAAATKGEVVQQKLESPKSPAKDDKKNKKKDKKKSLRKRFFGF